MSGSVMKLTCLFLVCIIVSGPITANADLTCGSVTSYLAPCIGYLTQRGASLPPACCTGVRNLNDMASTTPDRQKACRCLQSTAKAFSSSLDTSRAAGLPGVCKVNIPYKISPSTNCATVR